MLLEKTDENQQITNTGEGVQKKVSSFAVGGNVNWYNQFTILWKTVWRYLRELNIELPYDLEIPLLGIYSDKTSIEKDTCIPVIHSSQCYSQQLRHGNNLNAHRQKTGLRRCGTCIQWKIFSHKN